MTERGTATQPGRCVWGVDTSTKAVDIVSVGDTGAWGEWVQINAPRERFAGAQTLTRAALLTRDLAVELAGHDPPALVVVESPYVRGGGQDLLMNFGAILAALGEIVACPIVEVASATWKAFAPGHGHASKDDIAAFAFRQGFECDRQDQADAYCMALYGQDLLRRRTQNGKSS